MPALFEATLLPPLLIASFVVPRLSQKQRLLSGLAAAAFGIAGFVVGLFIHDTDFMNRPPTADIWMSVCSASIILAICLLVPLFMSRRQNIRNLLSSIDSDDN